MRWLAVIVIWLAVAAAVIAAAVCHLSDTFLIALAMVIIAGFSTSSIAGDDDD